VLCSLLLRPTAGHKHQDGAFVSNNPAGLAIHEAKCLFPNRPIECILSVGTGTCPPTQVPKNKGFVQQTLTTLVKACTSPDRIDDVLADLIDNKDTHYFRFQPSDPVYACELDETDEAKLIQLQEAARKYAEENVATIQKLVDIIRHPLMKNSEEGKG